MSTMDPITLAVVRGALESTQREMTLTIEKTARSSVFNMARDYSNALFNWEPAMVLQGQDLPIHLGSLVYATKAVAEYFKGDIQPGDIYYHNDPTYGGSHICDVCVYKPVFFEGEVVFWAVSKGHLTDTGGPVPGSYNPAATEIYAEGLRIPPIKLWEQGKERKDIVNLILTNFRARRDQVGDMKAQVAAVNVAERNLIALCRKYGTETIKACLNELLDMADRHMRTFVRSIPDGVYRGRGIIEDAGHGFGDIEIQATVTVREDTLQIALVSPPQIPYFINSYWSNTMSGVYLAIMMYAQLPPPYNEGLYRCVTVDPGPPGTLINAREPAPHVNCTTTPSESITDAVRTALEAAVPERAVAGWNHCNGINIAGHDPRRPLPDNEYVTMVLGTQVGGAGGSKGYDGWHACGPQCDFGGLTSGDVELMEFKYPIILHRYGLVPDSCGAGRWRGGCGTIWEAEPIDHSMKVICFGEGRRIPPDGACGAFSRLSERKVGGIRVVRGDGSIYTTFKNEIHEIAPGDRFATWSPGGGGYGNPFEREPEKVVLDVRHGIISLESARAEYGVVLDETTLAIDQEATQALRQQLQEVTGP